MFKLFRQFAAVLLVSTSFCSFGQGILSQGFILNTDQARLDRQNAADAKAMAAWRIEDPWRAVNGHTNCILAQPGMVPVIASTPALEATKYLGKGWYEFWGEVFSVHQDGIVVKGYSTCPLIKDLPALFFVANFPYAVAEGEHLSPHVAFLNEARSVEKFEIAMGTKTIRRLDYGLVCNAPTVAPKVLTAQEVAAAKAASARKSAENLVKALAYNRAQADKGDAQGQFRMGERCLAGDGVAKDPQAAREWFAKASAQGHAEARQALVKLDETAGK